MGFKLPTREEISVKIAEKGIESLTPLEDFVYDEEPQIIKERTFWRDRLANAIGFCINEALATETEVLAQEKANKPKSRHWLFAKDDPLMEE